jgi:pimeloyl-ACP methyl ester carboxylesterase
MKETLHAIATPRGTIRGMIHLPEADRFPLCCLFHGFQGNRIGSYAHLVDLSRALCGAGIGVARFDFIGSGESDGLFEGMTVSGELQDLLEIVSYAGIVCGGRETGLFLAGHSMGASVAGMAAGAQLPGAAGLILLAPAGEVSERITDSMAEFFDGPEGKAVYPLELNGQLIGEEFRRDAESLEMLESARRYPGPVLVVTGGRDETVPESVADRYAGLFPRGRHITLDGCGHSFGTLSCREELHREVARFILEN